MPTYSEVLFGYLKLFSIQSIEILRIHWLNIFLARFKKKKILTFCVSSSLHTILNPLFGESGWHFKEVLNKELVMIFSEQFSTNHNNSMCNTNKQKKKLGQTY